MWHEEVIADSLARYGDQLAQITDHGASQGLVQARNAIRAFNEAALKGDLLNGFTVAHLAPLEPVERMQLVNACSVGFGNPCGLAERPGLMILGTEHAYDQKAQPPRSLAIEGCALSALWHAKAGAAVAAALADKPAWARVRTAFQRDPSAFYGMQKHTHTWSKAAYTVCQGDTADLHRLFRSVYMMELSVHATPTAARGQSITSTRIDFLRRVAAACAKHDPELGRRAIGTLWFHGRGRNATFRHAREAMIRAFFGLGEEIQLEAVELCVAGLKVHTWTYGDRMALWTRALSGTSGASNAYWEGVSALLGKRVFQVPKAEA